MADKSYHSVCAWTFNPGKGGFTPGDMRPEWSPDTLDTAGKVRLVAEKIRPRLPENVELGMEMHYDFEYNEQDAAVIADTLSECNIALAMATPGAHAHFAYGGIASLDADERKAGEDLGRKALELTYGPLKKAWHANADQTPSFVLWNGSFGYDLASPAIRQMYDNLKESTARLCKLEAEMGGDLYIAVEPKPNEGHPAMLLPTVASALLFWYKLEKEYGVPFEKKGVNKEFGHSEMIGLDHGYDTVEEIDNNALVHMHINSQGYNDGIVLGGPGKYDIDHGARVNGMNIAIAALMQDAGYSRWKGHDMQPRAYDNENQAVDRVVRSILSWEACEQSAAELDRTALMTNLQNRDTAKAEDLMRSAVVRAQQIFDKYYE